MELLATLQLSFGRPRPARIPRNLLELAELLSQPDPGPEAPGFCRLWAEELRRLRDHDQETLGKKRGRLRRLWAEQCLIYDDLIAALLDPQPQAAHFHELLDEFADCLKDMEEWSRSEDPRCLACGWDGEDKICPHCRLRLLSPVRQPRGGASPIQLAPHHQEVLEVVTSVLRGESDLDRLQVPLNDLHDDFRRAVADARAHPELEVVAEILEVARDGLSQMTQVFEDGNCQHLEDGWSAFYLSQLALSDALHEDSPDQVAFLRE